MAKYTIENAEQSAGAQTVQRGGRSDMLHSPIRPIAAPLQPFQTTPHTYPGDGAVRACLERGVDQPEEEVTDETESVPSGPRLPKERRGPSSRVESIWIRARQERNYMKLLIVRCARTPVVFVQRLSHHTTACVHWLWRGG